LSEINFCCCRCLTEQPIYEFILQSTFVKVASLSISYFCSFKENSSKLSKKLSSQYVTRGKVRQSLTWTFLLLQTLILRLLIANSLASFKIHFISNSFAVISPQVYKTEQGNNRTNFLIAKKFFYRWTNFGSGFMTPGVWLCGPRYGALIGLVLVPLLMFIGNL